MPPELFVMVRTHYKQLKSMNVYRKLQSIHSVLEGNFETDLYIFRIEKFLECTGGYFGVHLEFFWSSSGVLQELIWSSSGVLVFLEVSEVVLEISGVWTSGFS